MVFTIKPEVKDEARYTTIFDNIRQSLASFNIIVNDDWDGIIYLNGQDPTTDTFPWGGEYNGGDESY